MRDDGLLARAVFGGAEDSPLQKERPGKQHRSELRGRGEITIVFENWRPTPPLIWSKR